MKSKVKWLAVLIGSIVITQTGASVYAFQQESIPSSAITLEEVVVTATRDKEEVRRVPANVSVITSQEIEKSNATTLVDVLDKLESIQFRSYSGNSSQAFIDMRGFGGDNPFGKALVLLDGRRLNRPDMASINWMQIPLNSIERIEVVRGAGSVLYGDAAIGGVINIITKKGKGKPTFNTSVIAGSYGLHDERVSLSGAADKWTYALAGESNTNSGYRDRSKLSSQGGSFDIGYDASDRLNVSLGISFNKTDYQMPGALTKAQMDQNRRQYQPATPANWANAAPDDDGSDKYTNVNLGIKTFLGSFGQAEVNVLYGSKSLETNMPSYSFNKFSKTDADTYSITPKYVLEKDIFGFGNKLIVGIDYYREPYKKEIFNDRERTSKRSRADLTKDSLGYYVREELSLLKTLILNAGYRSERAAIEASNTDTKTPANTFTKREKTYNAEAYEAGLNWLLGEKSKVFSKVATVYRIPFLDEVASFNGWSSGPLFLNDLEKEKGFSMEAGTEFYPVDHLKVGITFFRIDMEDEIQYVPVPGGGGYNQNVGKTRHDGVEASISYLWGKLARVYGNFTYHMARFENGINNKKELPLVPNRMANAGVEIFLPWHLTLRPEVRYVSEAYLSLDNDNNTEKLEGHTLYDLYLSYHASVRDVSVKAFFGVENLTDEKYSLFGSDNVSWGGINTYYPMPGITFKGGLSFEF
jgi:iron complex outermembrane receptor protein